jgi:pseudaminic acid cytidylyltransferase
MTTLAIIPARGGSKRIPKKNIKDFLGKPIIAYPIQVALESGLFDEVMVSTDDEEIAGIAEKYGAKVPFFRSKKTSDDFATTTDVLLEVMETYEKQGMTFDLICCIYPTACLVTKERLDQAHDILINEKLDTVFPVIRYGHPIQRAFVKRGDLLTMAHPENIFKRTQDLEPNYHDSGQFYWLDYRAFKQNKAFFSSKCGGIEIKDWEAQDIDSLIDWKLAELKYKLMHS